MFPYPPKFPPEQWYVIKGVLPLYMKSNFKVQDLSSLYIHSKDLYRVKVSVPKHLVKLKGCISNYHKSKSTAQHLCVKIYETVDLKVPNVTTSKMHERVFNARISAYMFFVLYLD